MTPSGIEPATFRFVAKHLNHCANTTTNTNSTTTTTTTTSNNNNNNESEITVCVSLVT